MKITEYLKTVEKIPAWDRIPAISDEELAEMILDAERFDTMDKPYGGAGVDMVRRYTMVKYLNNLIGFLEKNPVLIKQNCALFEQMIEERYRRRRLNVKDQFYGVESFDGQDQS